MTQNKRCIIEGCERTDVEAKGWCLLHYSRWRYHGDANWEPPKTEERFWEKVDKSDGCWLWNAAISTSGYGHFRYEKKVREAHLVSYMLLVGDIPEGMQLDHTCHTNDATCKGGVSCVHRRCVNPSHLQPVTGPENMRRGLSGIRGREKTHCPDGHPYDEANTLYIERGNGYNRMCRACARNRARERRQREREANLGRPRD